MMRALAVNSTWRLILPALMAAGVLAFALAVMLISGDRRSRLERRLTGYGAEPEPDDRGPVRGDLAETRLVHDMAELTGRIAERVGLLARVEEKLVQADLPVRPTEAIFFYLAFVFVVVVGAFLLIGLGPALVLTLLAGVAPIVFLELRRRRRLRKFERIGELGEGTRLRGFLYLLMRQERFEVLFGIFLHETHIVCSLAAPGNEHPHPLPFQLGKPHFDHARVAGKRLHQDLLRDRAAAAAGARMRLDGCRNLVAAGHAQVRQRRSAGRLRCARRARGVKLFGKLREQLGVAVSVYAVQDEMFLSDQLAAAHQKHLHARLALSARERNQVHVEPCAPNDFLIFRHAANLHDAIAQPRCRFELEMLRSANHVALQPS